MVLRHAIFTLNLAGNYYTNTNRDMAILYQPNFCLLVSASAAKPEINHIQPELCASQSVETDKI